MTDVGFRTAGTPLSLSWCHYAVMLAFDGPDERHCRSRPVSDVDATGHVSECRIIRRDTKVILVYMDREYTPTPLRTLFYMESKSYPPNIDEVTHLLQVYTYIYIWLDNSSQSGYIGERILPTLTKACVGPWCSSGGNNNSWQWGQCATKPSAYDLETPCKKEVTWSPSCRRR